MEIYEKVLEEFKTNQAPLKSAQIAEKLGVEKAEVDKAIKKMKKEEVIYSPKACFYAIKE